MKTSLFCISGGFALATFLGANLSSPEWSKVDLDIYLSNRDYLMFMRALARWTQEQRIISYDYRFHTANFNFEPDWHEWETAPDFFLDHIVEFTVTRNDITKNRRIKFYFVITELTSPKQCCEKIFPFTFLMNTLVIRDDWRLPAVSMKYSRDVMEKDGRYSDFFKAYWESQWRRWQNPGYRRFENTSFHFLIGHEVASIKVGQQKANKLKDTRRKYEIRGFFIHGPVPKREFVPCLSPYEECMRKRNECVHSNITSPSLRPVRQSPPQILKRGDGEQDIRYCEVYECTDVCFIYAGDIDMYLCYRHRQFSAEDKLLQENAHQLD